MRPDLEEPYAEPRSKVEEELAQIWAEVLSLDRVGIHDNFFDLGGHSLSAAQIVARLHKNFRIQLPLRCLFDRPTVAELALAMEQAAREEASLPVSLLPVSKEGPLRLSFAEEGLWLLDQLRPGMTPFNMQSSVRLRGALEVLVLERSLNALIQRHDSLRTTFSFEDNNPIRVIAPTLTVDLPLIQLDRLADANKEIRRIAAQDEKRSFDLAKGPLLRTCLLRGSEFDHVFIVTMHHIVTDAWSGQVFLRELLSLYEAYSQGKEPALADLPIQYSDYASWVRQPQQRGQTQSQVSYWKTKLQGVTVPEIPADYPRPEERSFRGAKQQIQLSRNLSRELKELCKQERTTLFMTLLAAFNILLHRYTGKTDIVVGSTIAGRSRPEFENLIGTFINLLALRSDLSGGLSFRDLLRHVREVCLEAYQYQDVPFDKLMEELRPDRDLSRSPFFQVLFNVVNLPPVQAEVAGLTVDLLSRPDDTARFDLTIYAPETNESVDILAAYNTDLFSESRIAEMLEQYRDLLEQIVIDPNLNIDDYSLVTSSARGMLPDPSAPLDDRWLGAVHELFSLEAGKYPEKIAVEDSREAWSYSELDSRSNQLARYLLGNGIRRDDIVAIYGSRSATLVSALLGILKARAAFCILDPAHPAQRLKDYLALVTPRGLIQIEDAGKPTGPAADILREYTFWCRLTLPQLGTVAATDILSEYSTDDPKLPVTKDDLAYVIFTSGSTGKPKGVMGLHGPLTHFLPWLKETFELTANDRFSFISGISTNKLQREIFTALSLGGTLCVPDSADIGNFGKLDEWMRKKEISVVHLTPAMAQLLEETAREPVPLVRQVFFGGDLLRTRDVDRVRKLMPQAQIVNFYNSSETQRGGGYAVIAREKAENEKDIPSLGYGVKDVQLLVLNRKGHMAGIGELGEICIRSPHMARGYLGDHELTRARFIINPFTGKQGDRIYRTGEQGRYMPNGSLEFVTRGENQVSIRGFRVDLGEVESVLKCHEGVSEAVVSLYVDSTDRLVAYLVANRGFILSIDEIRVFLRARLPNYMIPAVFMIVDSLPLTPTGKVDRRALPAVNLRGLEQEKSLVGPRTPVEERVAEIWKKVLGLKEIGIGNNFFDLGGHSLLAIHVMSRLREVFHVDLPLRCLFEAPTVGEMAAVITEHQKLREEELNRILTHLESLSDEEAQRLVSNQSKTAGARDSHE